MNTRPFVRLAAHWETKEEKTLCDLNANIHGIRSKLKRLAGSHWLIQDTAKIDQKGSRKAVIIQNTNYDEKHSNGARIRMRDIY